MERKYELIEHTADIFVKAYGASVAEAFGVVAEAMFALIVDDTPIAGTEQLELRVESIDRESLLVSFLSELIAIHEIQGLVFGRCEVEFDGDCALRARLHGERFDESRHQHGVMIKAASYHMMEIAEPEGNQSAYVKVLFDI